MIENRVWNLIDRGLDNSHRPHPVGRRRPIIAYSFGKATLHIQQGLDDIHEVHRSIRGIFQQAAAPPLRVANNA